MCQCRNNDPGFFFKNLPVLWQILTLTFDCRHATTLWKNVFLSKVVARKLKSLRPTSPWRLADPCIYYIKPPPCVTILHLCKTWKFQRCIPLFGCGVQSRPGCVIFASTYGIYLGVNLTLNRVNTGISIQQKPEVHIYWIVLQNKARNLCNIQGLHCLSIVRL